jgi:hypothetical protein
VLDTRRSCLPPSVARRGFVRALSFGGTVHDITERKEREEKERLLMCEINHRDPEIRGQ